MRSLILIRDKRTTDILLSNNSDEDPVKMRAAELGSLVLFVALVLGGGLIIGFATAPGAWYAALSKPPFSPPNWIFAPVWSTLYIIIAIAGWRVWREGRNNPPMKVGTAGSEFRLVAHLLLRSSHRYRPWRNRAAPDHDHWFHHDILAAG